MAIREEQIVINGLSINYAVAGSGRPMILLHNGGGFWHCWEYQLNYFSSEYEVFAMDLPSFGESDTPDSLLTLELLYETLNAFVESKKLKDIVLIGNCIGASASYLYSKRHNQNVHKLILFNICPGDLIFPKFIFRSLIPALNERPRIKRRVESILKFVFLKTPVRRKFPSILFGRGWGEEDPLFQRYIDKFKTTKQTNARVNLLFSAHTYTFKDYLKTDKRIAHMLMWGADNSVTSYLKHGKYHKELLNPDSFELISNSGHLCMYEQPNEVNEYIDNYLKMES